MAKRITKEKFAETQHEEMEFLELITPMLPASIEDLQPLITYHENREFCNRYCWTLLRNLWEYKFLKISDGIVELP